MEGIWMIFCDDKPCSDMHPVFVKASSEKEAIQRFVNTSSFKDDNIDPSDESQRSYGHVTFFKENTHYCIFCDKKQDECSCDRVIYDEDGKLINQEVAIKIAEHMIYKEGIYVVKKIVVQ